MSSEKSRIKILCDKLSNISGQTEKIFQLCRNYRSMETEWSWGEIEESLIIIQLLTKNNELIKFKFKQRFISYLSAPEVEEWVLVHNIIDYESTVIPELISEILDMLKIPHIFINKDTQTKYIIVLQVDNFQIRGLKITP